MILLETERLILRHFHLFDGEAMNRVFGDPEVMRYGPGVQTQAWVREWLNHCLEDYSKLGFGPWAVVSRLDSTVLGYAGLFHFPDIDGRPEIEVGYRLARTYWGQGYATEAVKGILKYAFHVLCLPRLIALIDPQNTASIHVAEKVGMHYEKDVMLEGYTYPDRLYSIKTPATGREPV
jgi:[ribosomal protein S5]-alanine N-acetyltransferase